MKTLHFSDLHQSPKKWPKHSRLIREFILSQVETIRPAYVFNWGDFFDGLNPDDTTVIPIRRWVEKMSSLTTLAGVYGTLSHDPPGCYDSWESLGYVNLELGKPYQFPDLLVFGIPELTKRHLKNVSSISGGNQTYNALLAWVIKNHLAPLRSKNPSIPCIVGLHGEVIDNNATEHDRISSGRKIRTTALEEIGATAYIGGHIHTPWRSERIPFEYCGSTGHDSRPWNNRGFQPHMILIDITGPKSAEWLQIDYPVLRKEKRVISRGNTGDPVNPENTHLWLEYQAEQGEDVPRDKILKHFHGLGFPEIRLTIKPNNCEIEPTQLTTQNPTAIDYAISINPNLTEDQQEIINQISRRSEGQREPVEIDFIGSEYRGLSLLSPSSETFTPPTGPGLYRIKGPTGSGKSTRAGTMYPLPGLLKSTESQKSAYYCFFEGQDAALIKRYTVNGEPVTVQALINASKPQIEYTLPGTEQKTTNYKEAANILAALFGEEDILLSTVFQAQAGELKGAPPSLALCTKIELRGVFLRLLGLSREPERKRCNEVITEIQEKINSLNTEKTIKTKDLNQYKNEKKMIVETLAKYQDIEDSLYINQVNKEKHDYIKKQRDKIQLHGQTLGKIKTMADNLPAGKCPNCGYLESAAAGELDRINREYPDLKNQVPQLRKEYIRLTRELESVNILPQDEEDNLKRGSSYLKIFDKKIIELIDSLKVIDLRISGLEKKLNDWVVVRLLFKENGIPLREIENNKCFIEQVINEKLNIFEEGRYQSRIDVHDFNILIHDSRKEREAPFYKYSPGERGIIGATIREGAIKAAEEFQGLKYKFRVVDEGDNGISPEYINQYYDILKSSAEEGRRVFVISHVVQDDNIFDGVI